jgi:hypothetical protein
MDLSSAPAKIKDVADYLAAYVKAAELTNVEDRRTRGLAIENMADGLARLARNKDQENIVRNAVNTVAWYLREENVGDASSQHLVVMALNQLRVATQGPDN